MCATRTAAERGSRPRIGGGRPTPPHKAEFHQRDHGISIHVDVAVAPADDVELRQITLHNETDQPRRLTVTSAGEPVLLALGDAATHPAFSQHVSSRANASRSSRRSSSRVVPSRTKEDRAVLVHRLVREGSAVTFAGYETDRRRLLRSLRERPRPSLADRRLQGHARPRRSGDRPGR